MRGRFVKSNALNSNMPLEAGQVQINIYTLLASKISLQWVAWYYFGYENSYPDPNKPTFKHRSYMKAY